VGKDERKKKDADRKRLSRKNDTEDQRREWQRKDAT
jgi:hypothetical protein